MLFFNTYKIDIKPYGRKKIIQVQRTPLKKKFEVTTDLR